VGHCDAGGPREDFGELNKLAIEVRVVGRGEGEFDGPGRGLGWCLGVAHVLKPGAGCGGVDQSRAERHEELVVG
jgi:hypothetical protein